MAAQGKLQPGAGGDPLGAPQPRGRGKQPAAREERAAEPPQWAQGFSGGRGRPEWPLAEEPPGKGRQLAEGGRSAEEGAGRRRGSRGLTPGPWRGPVERLPAGDPGERAPPEPLTQKWEKRERDRRGGERLCRRNHGRKARGAKGPAAKPAWEWNLLALCLWGALQMGPPWCLRGTALRGKCSPLTR